METASSLTAFLCGLAILTAWTAPQITSSMAARSLKLLGGLGLCAFILSCISPYDDLAQREWICPATSQAQLVLPNSHVLPGKVSSAYMHVLAHFLVQPNAVHFANVSIRLRDPDDQRSLVPAAIHSPPLLL